MIAKKKSPSKWYSYFITNNNKITFYSIKVVVKEA